MASHLIKLCFILFKNITFWLTVCYFVAQGLCLIFADNKAICFAIGISWFVIALTLLITIQHKNKLIKWIKGQSCIVLNLFNTFNARDFKLFFNRHKAHFYNRPVHYLYSTNIGCREAVWCWLGQISLAVKSLEFSGVKFLSSNLGTYIKLENSCLSENNKVKFANWSKEININCKQANFVLVIEYDVLSKLDKNRKAKLMESISAYQMINTKCNYCVPIRMYIDSRNSALNGIVRFLHKNDIDIFDKLSIHLLLNDLTIEQLEKKINIWCKHLCKTVFGCVEINDSSNNDSILDEILSVNYDLNSIVKAIEYIKKELAARNRFPKIELIFITSDHLNSEELNTTAEKFIYSDFTKIIKEDLRQRRIKMLNSNHTITFSLVVTFIIAIASIATLNWRTNHYKMEVNNLVLLNGKIKSNIDLWKLFEIYNNNYKSYARLVFPSNVSKINSKVRKLLLNSINYNLIINPLKNLENNLKKRIKSWDKLSLSIKQSRYKEYLAILKDYMYLLGQHEDNLKTVNDEPANARFATLAENLNFSKKKIKNLVAFAKKNKGLLVNYGEKQKNIISTILKQISPYISNPKNLFREIENIVFLKSRNFELYEVLSLEPTNNVYMCKYKLNELYTKTGAKKIFPKYLEALNLKLASYNRIFGINLDTEKIKQEVTTIYWQNYLNAWKNFIGSISSEKFNNIANAKYKISSSLINEKLLIDMITKIGFEFRFIKENFGYLESGLLVKLLSNIPVNKENSIYKLVSNYNMLMKEILAELEAGEYNSENMLSYLTKLMNRKEIYASAITKARLKLNLVLNTTIDLDVRPFYKCLFLSPLNKLETVLSISFMRDVEKKWQQEIVPFANKIELDSPGRAGSSVRQIIELYHPQYGLYTKFYRKYLSNLSKGNDGSINRLIKPSLSTEFSGYIYNSHNLAKLLFMNGGNPNTIINFYLEPTPIFSEINGSIYGSKFRYRNEPEEWLTFNWPNYGNNNMIFIKAKEINNGSIYQYVVHGMEGLLVMLNNAKIYSTESKNVVKLVLTLKDTKLKQQKLCFLVRVQSDVDLLSAAKGLKNKIPSAIFNIKRHG